MCLNLNGAQCPTWALRPILPHFFWFFLLEGSFGRRLRAHLLLHGHIFPPRQGKHRGGEKLRGFLAPATSSSTSSSMTQPARGFNQDRKWQKHVSGNCRATHTAASRSIFFDTTQRVRKQTIPGKLGRAPSTGENHAPLKVAKVCREDASLRVGVGIHHRLRLCGQRGVEMGRDL